MSSNVSYVCMIHSQIPNLMLKNILSSRSIGCCRIFRETFLLDWDPALYFIIDEKTIGFQVRHKDKLRIEFKDADDGFQADSVCDCGYTYSFIYRNDDIPY